MLIIINLLFICFITQQNNSSFSSDDNRQSPLALLKNKEEEISYYPSWSTIFKVIAIGACSVAIIGIFYYLWWESR